MAKFDTIRDITPAHVNHILHTANFSEASSDDATTMIENEGRQAANLVNILKEDVLSDDTALKEISEATDIDVEALKEIADEKSTAIEEGTEAGADKEEIEEYFFSRVENRMSEILNNAFDRNGVYAFFSEDAIDSGMGSPDDNKEAIKIIKYVDDSALEEKGASEVADIISEATDADKDLIEEVLELKEEAAETANFSAYTYFSAVAEQMAAEAAIAADATADAQVQSVMNALAAVSEDQKRRIAAGEGVLKRQIQTQQPGEATVADTDKLSSETLPENIGARIEADTNNSYNLGTVAAPSSQQPGEVMAAFSTAVGQVSGFLPGDARTALAAGVRANFDRNSDVYDDQIKSILSSVASIQTRNM